MFDPKTINHAFSRASGVYDDHAQLQQLVREEAIRMGETCWGEGAAILDAGGGTGSFTHETRRMGLRWNVTHLDLSFGMCQTAYDHTTQVVNASAAAIPFADASFDGVFSSLMLQWASEPLVYLRELARVLRPGGQCVITLFTDGTLKELRESFAQLDDALHVNRFADPASLTAITVHSGFRLLACEEETFTIHYPDVTALMRSIKAIGASTKQEKGKGGLMTPRQLARLDELYRTRFASKKKGQKNHLPATWQVLYMLLEKPESP